MLPLPSSKASSIEKQRNRAQSNMGFLHLPADVFFKIASSLQVSDICALSCCSRFLRELCEYDFLWETLARERWPNMSSSFVSSFSSSSLGWKRFYIQRHIEISRTTNAMLRFIEQRSASGPIEVRDYLKAMLGFLELQLSFKDVQMVLFKLELNELLNLVGVHYCIDQLGVPANEVVEALQSHKIADRHVCVKWWKLGRWYYGFRMRDEHQTCQISLENLAMEEGEHIRGVLLRGAVHEVLRVQISLCNPVSNHWSQQKHPKDPHNFLL